MHSNMAPLWFGGTPQHQANGLVHHHTHTPSQRIHPSSRMTMGQSQGMHVPPPPPHHHHGHHGFPPRQGPMLRGNAYHGPPPHCHPRPAMPRPPMVPMHQQQQQHHHHHHHQQQLPRGSGGGGPPFPPHPPSMRHAPAPPLPPHQMRAYPPPPSRMSSVYPPPVALHHGMPMSEGPPPPPMHPQGPVPPCQLSREYSGGPPPLHHHHHHPSSFPLRESRLENIPSHELYPMEKEVRSSTVSLSSSSSSSSPTLSQEAKSRDQDAAEILLCLRAVPSPPPLEGHQLQQQQPEPSLSSCKIQLSQDQQEQQQQEEEEERKPLPTRLAMPEDESKLNSMHCFLRSDLLELFAVETKKTGRVGLRCVHCAQARARKVSSEGEAPMAVFYPKSISELYRLVTSWQRVHLRKCRNLPSSVRETYQKLKETDKTRGKTQYWVTSALALGLVDCTNKAGGIRFRHQQPPQRQQQPTVASNNNTTTEEDETASLVSEASTVPSLQHSASSG